MSISEFEIIRQYFKSIATHRKDVHLGIGDDAAVVSVPSGQQLVTTVDTLVEGVHFVSETRPEDLAHKALAVNLSDLAAMGAEPAWVTLSLTIPEVDQVWLERFSQTFATLCRHYDVQLIGGDTCRGTMSITVQAMGLVPQQSAILRSGANPGDLIYVTGFLGDAGAGLETQKLGLGSPDKDQEYLLKRLNQPTPRLEMGVHLRHMANAMIDISDGLVQDLKHILDASNVGAIVDLSKLPLSESIQRCFSLKQSHSYAMTAGEDYELCFTINPDQQSRLESRLSTASCQITQVGWITPNKGLQVRNDNQPVAQQFTGFQHFATQADLETNA